ncbi:MAG: hypothetical protein GX813_03730 [Erysipelotrichia bacterium]|nr:hypothetical protein [Erysipelotrichia bacterium]
MLIDNLNDNNKSKPNVGKIFVFAFQLMLPVLVMAIALISLSFLIPSITMLQKIELTSSKDLLIALVIFITNDSETFMKILYITNTQSVAVIPTIQITSIALAFVLGIITMVVSNATKKRNSPEIEDCYNTDFDE